MNLYIFDFNTVVCVLGIKGSCQKLIFKMFYIPFDYLVTYSYFNRSQSSKIKC